MAIKTIEYKGFVIRYDNTFAEAYSNNRSVWYTKNLKSLKEHIDFYGEARVRVLRWRLVQMASLCQPSP